MRSSGELRHQANSFSEKYAMWFIDTIKLIDELNAELLELKKDDALLEKMNTLMERVQSSVSLHASTGDNLKAVSDVFLSIPNFNAAFDRLNSRQVLNYTFRLIDCDTRLKEEFVSAQPEELSLWGRLQRLAGW